MIKKIMSVFKASPAKTIKSIPPSADDMGRYDVIYKSYSIHSLKGIGEEYLLNADGEVICIFLDGNWKSYCTQVDYIDADTLVGAA